MQYSLAVGVKVGGDQMLRIGIVDDIEQDRSLLSHDIRDILADLDQHVYCQAYSSAAAFLNDFERDAYDLVFLDIRTGNIDGIELSRQLRMQDTELLIIFISTSPAYMFDVFPVHPFDYLVKPYDRSRLAGVLGEVERVIRSDKQSVAVITDQGERHIPLRHISAIESWRHSAELHLTDGRTIKAKTAFDAVEHRVSLDRHFLACNKGTIVNLDQVSSAEGGIVHTKDGHDYSLRMRDQKALSEHIARYVADRIHH